MTMPNNLSGKPVALLPPPSIRIAQLREVRERLDKARRKARRAKDAVEQLRLMHKLAETMRNEERCLLELEDQQQRAVSMFENVIASKLKSPNAFETLPVERAALQQTRDDLFELRALLADDSAVQEVEPSAAAIQATAIMATKEKRMFSGWKAAVRRRGIPVRKNKKAMPPKSKGRRHPTAKRSSAPQARKVVGRRKGPRVKRKP